MIGFSLDFYLYSTNNRLSLHCLLSNTKIERAIFQILKLAIAMTTNELLQTTQNDIASASNVIDQMISMSILGYGDSNNQNLNKSASNQESTSRRSRSPRFVYQIKLIEVFRRETAMKLVIITSLICHSFQNTVFYSIKGKSVNKIF